MPSAVLQEVCSYHTENHDRHIGLDNADRCFKRSTDIESSCLKDAAGRSNVTSYSFRLNDTAAVLIYSDNSDLLTPLASAFACPEADIRMEYYLVSAEAIQKVAGIKDFIADDIEQKRLVVVPVGFTVISGTCEASLGNLAVGA